MVGLLGIFSRGLVNFAAALYRNRVRAGSTKRPIIRGEGRVLYVGVWTDVPGMLTVLLLWRCNLPLFQQAIQFLPLPSLFFPFSPISSSVRTFPSPRHYSVLYM